MIELNLTYEESKKILDLGYDFSKVSSEFRFPGEEKIKYILVCRYKDGDVELYSSENYDTEIYSTQEFGITPIIPKAALEACLPDYFFAGGLNSIRLRHNSAYEAFIWCHESYQEELKAKFDEVMG